MARTLTFKIGRREFSAAPVKIDRRKLYGWSEVMAVDDRGEPCRLLTADESGKYIIPTGGTGIGILDTEGRWVERSQLKTVDPAGKPARLFESSFAVVNTLKDKVTARDMLDYSITDLYELTDPSPGLPGAVGENIYRFEYTYNDSYDPAPAFIMVAEGVLYMLVGVKNFFEFLCFGDCEAIDEDHDDRIIEEGDEDIDFSMF